ncbi:MAG: putative DNA modification/repair radical SAM protein, partial [Desulfosarcina sp.]
MLIEDKLTILADAAKYDASCASSGSRRRNSGRRLGHAAPSGICHSYTEDGRCVSLLKILYTNVCIYDCAYCVNRSSNDIPRAAFTAREIVDLTIDFYRRNYIEGLFLSSGVIRSPDETMERLIRSAQMLRRQGFNGYIHLKCIPFAGRRLIQAAGRHADRLSVNIELPTETSLKRLTGEKTFAAVLTPMDVIRETIVETREDRKRLHHVPAFAPAGQSTQLIVGASPESDFEVLTLADRLYRQQSLKRVYYSAYVPVCPPGGWLPDVEQPPLRRENRLYQADWLMRLYGFSMHEVISRTSPWLDLKIDPKQAFARQHPELFPVDINTADREMILRVPGIGLKTANRIVGLRKKGRLRFEHLRQLGAVVSRAQPFICCDGMETTQWMGTTTLRRPTPARTVGYPQCPPSAADPSRRTVFETDGSFEGLLTAVFRAYATSRIPDAIVSTGNAQRGLFDDSVRIDTAPAVADRVWTGLKRYLGARQRQRLFQAHLSGHADVETLILQRIVQAIPGRRGLTSVDLSVGIRIDQFSQVVRREAHRIKGFIRFQQTGDGSYLALIAPRYDVLPLIRRHFQIRYADQNWMIYDTARKYGLGYHQQTTREIRLDSAALATMEQEADEQEHLRQVLWQRYYDAVNIRSRNNPALHRRQLPRRYWRYLTEKNPK